MIENFLRLVTPSQGIHGLSVKPPRGAWRDIPCDSQAQMETLALSYGQTCDVYFALSSFSAPFSRKANQALYQRSFWLDVDCGPEKAAKGEGYASQSDGLAALRGFLRQSGLPMPFIVSSGYGWHLYWPFTVDIQTASWKALAHRLALGCKALGFRVDPARTEDPSSVLRVPGTNNHKRGQAQPVEIRAMPKQCYNPVDLARTILHLPIPKSEPSPIPKVAAPAGMQAMAEFFHTDSFTKPPEGLPPKDWQDMVRRCAQIRHMGESSYPAWMLAARTLLHSTGGTAIVEALSKYDGGTGKYDPAAVRRLCNSLESRPDVGPATCQAFRACNPKCCANCPYWTKIKTPWSLGGIPAQAPITMPAVDMRTVDLTQGEIPLGSTENTMEITPFRSDDGRYQVVPGQGICVNYEDDEGVPRFRVLTPIEVYIHTLCIDGTQGGVPKRTYLLRKIAPGCAPVDIPFALEDALGPQKLELWMAECGMLPPPKAKKEVYQFMNTYIAAIQNKLPEVYVRNHFGWDKWTDRASGKTYPGFIVGQTMYTATGEKQIRLDERAASIAPKLTSKGTLEGWKAVPALYQRLDQKFAQLLMCASFGAPLMKYGLGTATNIAYNFWDVNGGKGKSSVLKALASVWGDPGQMLMGRTDTHAARFQQYAVFRNLPALIDEITGIYDADAASMLYDIVNGREKARSTSSGTGLAASGQWETVTVFTANQSMYEALRDYRAQTSATCMRLIESVCDFKDYSGTPEALVINQALSAARDNYGLAGRQFMQTILAKPQLLDWVKNYAEQFAVKHAVTADERFWLYGMAIPLCAGRVAKILGLLPYDIDVLEQWCVNVLLPQLRSKVKVAVPTGGNLLTDFLNDSLADTLIVRTHSRKTLTNVKISNQFASTMDPYVAQLPTRSLLVRRELDTGNTYVSSSALRIWCKRRGISLDSMLTDLGLRGFAPYGVAPMRFCLGSDVSTLPQSRQQIYKFRCVMEEENK